jgi:thiol-disulfide isomerase/thioredoxin
MNKLLCLFVFVAVSFQISAQTNFTALKIIPEYPKQGRKLSFEYNNNKSSLNKQPTVEVVVYLFTEKGPKILEPVITKKGTIYSGSITLDSNASCIAFYFSSGKEKDLNGSKGYIIPVFNKNNYPLDGYYAWASSLHNGYGEYLFGLPNDADKGLTILEEGLKQNPSLKNNIDFFSSYLNALSRAKKNEAAPFIAKELEDFEAKGNLNEAEFITLIQWYTRDKRKAKADSLTIAMKASFPEGDLKKNEAGAVFYKEKDPAKKAILFQEYVRKYPPTEANKFQINNFKSQLALAYGKAKDFKSYYEWSKGLSKAIVASNNNNLAWEMAEADENLEEAKKMAADASSYSKNELQHPTEKKPDEYTAKQWEDQRKSSYAMFGDTYAFILYKLGDYKTAYPIAKEAATINKLKDAEYNERYAMLAEKVIPTADAKKLIAQFVKDGVATAKAKEALKNLYIKEKRSDNGFDAYLEELEADAKNKKREKIAKSILNEVSPKFSLKDFEGKTLGLDDLKGKVIVVDFWATWCGPCIASMPAMSKTLTKYKDNENVKFLFVDTWESVENKLQNAKEFMNKKNYPFYVLMDNDNKMVADFKVSGIPTKFVIDKEGKIRFKSIGFSGNDDALVDELTTMIELAGK